MCTHQRRHIFKPLTVVVSDAVHEAHTNMLLSCRLPDSNTVLTIRWLLSALYMYGTFPLDILRPQADTDGYAGHIDGAVGGIGVLAAAARLYNPR